MMQTPSGPTPASERDRPAGDARTTLIELYRAGVRAVDPGRALRAALARDDRATAGRIWLIAMGKAAHPMAAAAVEVLEARGTAPAGGVIIAPARAPSPHPALDAVTGDHPVPGAGSFAAAGRLGELAARVAAGDAVWVLLSGGASSLAAAPVDGIAPDELQALYALLLGSGLDIAAMNTIRKRISRWGAGRLAVALQPARVRQFVISDVIGDDLAAIGSGPCVGDAASAVDVRASLDTAGLADRIPAGVRRYLLAVERDASLETPKAGHPAFRRVESTVIASNRIALEAIAARATALGFAPRILDGGLVGEAAEAGTQLAAATASYCGGARAHLSGRRDRPCLIWGGETTVTLPDGVPAGAGGRCQELALAAARALATDDRAGCGPSLLAAGTDGRDGATDAAGAIVDACSWRAIMRAGRDPAADLATHRSYDALDAIGALLRTGLTGTNVMDVAIALCDGLTA